MKIVILNGPNLNLLGKREPQIYGTMNFETYFLELEKKFLKHEFHYFQSNIEGELISLIHEHGFTVDGMVINAGGYSHTSVALADAIKSVTAKFVEVHISNIYKREEFRHKSFLSPVVDGVISGLGLLGYEMAVKYLVEKK